MSSGWSSLCADKGPSYPTQFAVFQNQGTAAPTSHRLRSTPFVAMVQATDLWDLHDLSRLRPLHGARGRSVLG